ncbi:MAG TPA: CocE/NonD family hydrolase [Vicinamibacteria bacterium]
MRFPRPPVVALVFVLLAISPRLRGDEAAGDVRARYTKYEHRIPMRDGKRLFTAVYVPKDTSKTYPILLNRTPYSVAPYGADQYRERLGPSTFFEREGYIVVYQDVRGRYMSEGEWVEMTPHKPKKSGPADVDESTDGWDTIDWLVKNVPGNNGRVGMWGISYPGFYTSASMIDAHPALKAASPQAPVTDLFMGDDSFHNGAFMLAANFGFYVYFPPRGPEPKAPATGRRFDYGTPDGYDFMRRLGTLSATRRYLADNTYYQDNLDHPTYDDFWKARNIAAHLKNIKHAVLTVGGWFDAENLVGPLLTYRTIEQTSPGTFNAIVMGPWSHGSWSRGDGDRLGNLDFGSKTGAFYREEVEHAFFARHLKGATTEAVAEATMFQTGTNEWRRYEMWPPRAAAKKAFYFAEGRRLRAEPPVGEAFDEYVSDPANPVPYLGYTAQGMRSDYMTEDQRFASTRPDVALYETEPLEEDLAVAGPIEVDLHVSTTGTDSDFVVMVVDVYPGDVPDRRSKTAGGADDDPPANAVKMGGYQQLVRGEPFRGKFRNSFEKPEPFVPGEPARIRFSLPDVCHVFRRGHRLMVQVQSSWFPLVDLNPQTFVDIPKATAADFKKATQRVHRSQARASSVTFLVEPARKQEGGRAEAGR